MAEEDTAPNWKKLYFCSPEQSQDEFSVPNPFEYSNVFDVKHDLINQQHKELFDLIRALDNDRNNSDLLKKVLGHTVRHFEDEEAVMEKIGTPAEELTEHKKIHAKLVKDAVAATSEKPVTDETINFLKHWLVSHILGPDQTMVRGFQKNSKFSHHSVAFHVVSVEGLLSTRPMGCKEHDAYVSCFTSEGHSFGQTQQVEDMEVPTWNLESGTLCGELTGEKQGEVIFQVFDNLTGFVAFLGEARLDVQDIFKQGNGKRVLQLKPRPKEEDSRIKQFASRLGTITIEVLQVPRSDTEIVQESWTLAKSKLSLDDIGALFYETLFTLVPSAKTTLFGKTDMRKQQIMLMQAIDYAVKFRDDLIPTLQQLGARHANYGVDAAHYPLVAKALIETFKKGLGSEFTDKMASAWSNVYDIIEKTMLSGALAPKPKKVFEKDAKCTYHPVAFHVVSVEGLLSTRPMGCKEHDAYVSCFTSEGQSLGQTRQVESMEVPTWNQESGTVSGELTGEKQGEVIFQVFDNLTGFVAFLGEARLDVQDIFKQGNGKRVLQLKPRPKEEDSRINQCASRLGTITIAVSLSVIPKPPVTATPNKVRPNTARTPAQKQIVPAQTSLTPRRPTTGAGPRTPYSASPVRPRYAPVVSWRIGEGLASPPFLDPSGHPIHDAELREEFAVYDKESVGFLDRTAFKKLYLDLEWYGMPPSENEIDRIFGQFARSQNDKISFDEFAVLLLRRTKL